MTLHCVLIRRIARAVIQARHAFYGSMLMGILAHHLSAAAGAEGVGAKEGVTEFNAFEVGWKLFDKDKLIVSSMLAMTVLLKDGVVDPDEYMTLCFGAKTPVPPPITDELSLWMTDAQWSALDPVCKLPKFTALAKDMEKNNDSWKEWCAIENCEKRELHMMACELTCH